MERTRKSHTCTWQCLSQTDESEQHGSCDFTVSCANTVILSSLIVSSSVTYDACVQPPPPPSPPSTFYPYVYFLLRVGGSFTATVDPRRG